MKDPHDLGLGRAVGVEDDVGVGGLRPQAGAALFPARQQRRARGPGRVDRDADPLCRVVGYRVVIRPSTFGSSGECAVM